MLYIVKQSISITRLGYKIVHLITPILAYQVTRKCLGSCRALMRWITTAIAFSSWKMQKYDRKGFSPKGKKTRKNKFCCQINQFELFPGKKERRRIGWPETVSVVVKMSKRFRTRKKFFRGTKAIFSGFVGNVGVGVGGVDVGVGGVGGFPVFKMCLVWANFEVHLNIPSWLDDTQLVLLCLI